ncbi:hypothetical protein B0H16DRAFT_1882611 [Mycena metata]|uniref:F-box domain-containing protein n=1 Tax=Mycena metata TaxID=1033252 RepID=A0AAD7NLX2_9AGAR|nr:hypothetical protein B0H16DRAFT_1882611 [Mycena metata]
MSVSPPCWQCGASAIEGPAFLDSIGRIPSNVARLLANNDPPSDDDIPVVRGRIDAGMARIDEIDSQIDMLYSVIGRLAEERTSIQKFVKQNATILSPIRRTPPELVFEILGQAWSFTRRIGDHRVNRPPWHFGHICRSWRASALASPYLWNSIEIFNSSAFPVADVSPQPMLEAQYSRSANHPLEVLISAWDLSPDDQWMKSFLSNCHCWGALRLRTVRHLLDDLWPIRYRLASLQLLELTTGTEDHTSYYEYPSPPRDIFKHAPKLSEIILTDPACRQLSVSLEIPWNQIVHYRGTYSPDSQLEILKAAPGLVECGLGTWGSVQDRVTLKHLRKLHIKGTGYLKSLEAPMLEQLSMSGQADQLPFFLRRSSCRLTRLALTYCSGVAALSEVLRALPGLTYFALEPNPGVQQETKQLFSAMTLSGLLSDLCPHLAEFAYGDRGLGSLEATLTRMIESRVQRGTLTFFRLWLLNPPAAAFKERLYELSCDGLDAAVISHAEAAEFMMSDRP